jgi:D-alanyl-D-alanine endopeptidase (penicillin-binding protein 7)
VVLATVSRATARSLQREDTPVFSGPEPEVDHDGMPLLKSSAFLVQDVQSGKILLEKNASVTQPIASITKLMTAMVVLDAQQNLAETLEITEGDVDMLKGTSSRLAVGTRLTREELLTLALMSSENRAASALSRNYPGGQAAFIEAMNIKTRMMGMNDTRFLDPSGLNKNNVSSARDLAILVANASRYPLIRDFSTRQEYSATLHGGRVHTFHNTNALVKDADWQIDVQKTGYINESGKCLVMQAWVSSKQVAIVLLDSWGRYTRLGDANRVRKWVETSMTHRDLASLHKGSVRTAAN